MPQALRVEIIDSLRDVSASDWDACANPAATGEVKYPREDPFNPFIAHAFLSALEESGCVGGRSGWIPQHIMLRDRAGAAIAATPLYIKLHSFGEYVFDQAWAQAYERAGGRYYPKLQVCAPFTPVSGRRLLARANAPAQARAQLLEAMKRLSVQLNASSVHVAFPTLEDFETCVAAGFLPRKDRQFHFFNDGYGDFEDFLSALAARKRKAIRKERAGALASGIEIEQLTGADIQERHWDAFFDFYMDTAARKWGAPYLNRAFFSLLGERMADHVLLVMARRGARPIAGALNLIGADALYGRNWGSLEPTPFLHFELCYYQAIDFALKRRLRRVEAGAQGEHKLARGYRAIQTYSAHYFNNRSLARAVSDYLAHERQAVEAIIGIDGDHAPFRKNLPHGS